MILQHWLYIYLCFSMTNLPLVSAADATFIIGVEDINYEPYYNED